MVSGPPPELAAVHHIGITVESVDETMAFWKSFLGVEPRWRQVLDGPYLSDVTGYPGINLDASFIDLPGGVMLATANPGNVHICFRVDDIDRMWQRAIDSGATPISPGPVEVTIGPNRGAKACYVRDPDGITLELFQSPPG